uniref:Putative SR140 protein n=1 Tax=Moniliophthora roreri TaxID=221103 RepID=A0A0W0F0F2_MONRR
MDKTKAKLASKLSNFFDNDDEESAFPHKAAVDDAKLTQYASGTQRKSRREREQELAEAKKREEEAHAAKAYAEFLDAFEGEGVGRKSASTFVKAGAEGSGSMYSPASRPTSGGMSVISRDGMSPTHVTSAPRPKGKREMDMFLEELKKDQAEREAKYSRSSHGRSATAMAAYDGQSGSKDRGDPQTSNVFVANLPPHVTEQSLGNFFARVGPVGSVKIMWPRNDSSSGPGADMTASRRSKNAGLSGFVSFMTRRDAEEALREFDGFDWGGSILRVGWSKAVPIAAKPMFSPNAEVGAGASAQAGVATIQGAAHNLENDDGHAVVPGTADLDRPEATTVIRLDIVAEVKGHGKKYEESLWKREANNSKYSFMKREHRRHAFYRGLIEDERHMSPEFEDDGYNSVYSTDSAEESERERTRKVKLGRLARRRFEAMLRALSGKRGEIARCMAFSLEHAEAAHEVADIIVSSLLVDSTPVPRKVARLHLICDILHNSAASVPSAWKFRQEFQSRLGIVFDHMANIYHSFPGRITAETFKKQITAIVDIWEDWIVFPLDFTTELRERLEGMSVEGQIGTEGKPKDDKTSASYASRFKSSSFQKAEDYVESESTRSSCKADIGEEPIDDLDGEPLKDNLGGEPFDDVDGVPMDDIDGKPVEEDIDGAPLDEGIFDREDDDVDGEPMDMGDDD